MIAVYLFLSPHQLAIYNNIKLKIMVYFNKHYVIIIRLLIKWHYFIISWCWNKYFINRSKVIAS